MTNQSAITTATPDLALDTFLHGLQPTTLHCLMQLTNSKNIGSALQCAKEIQVILKDSFESALGPGESGKSGGAGGCCHSSFSLLPTPTTMEMCQAWTHSQALLPGYPQRTRWARQQSSRSQDGTAILEGVSAEMEAALEELWQ
ncbi:hypothetical protein AAFF_G00037190 [Aldrovandia affinis]|uniref:Uncharacterized protein n=1 Tax=Aldrovandia affinis TaxID=143900 RepID=A0AAD7T652_9TELE|nr:hypothetical protein AAFF_G00037190 [Aldrovandia affinis]